MPAKITTTTKTRARLFAILVSFPIFVVDSVTV
jgi:hypothetical protein